MSDAWAGQACKVGSNGLGHGAKLCGPVLSAKVAALAQHLRTLVGSVHSPHLANSCRCITTHNSFYLDYGLNAHQKLSSLRTPPFRCPHSHPSGPPTT